MKKIFSFVVDKLEKIKELKKQNIKKRKEKKFPEYHKESENSVIQIDISTKTLLKIILVIFAFVFASQILAQLKTILIIVGISFFLAIGISPVLDSIEKYRVPRPIAILIIYLFFFGALAILFVQIIPIVADQFYKIATDFNNYIKGDNQISILNKLSELLRFESKDIYSFLTENLSDLSSNLKTIAGSTFEILSNIFNGVFNFIFALVLLFFILMEREDIGHFFLTLFPKKDRQYIAEKSQKVQKKMAEWFRGQIVLMIFVGLFMYIGMKILQFSFGMKYAATLGLLAGFMELFPYIGVFITGVLAILIAINISWVLVIAVLIWIAITQFVEGNFLVPVVMEKAVGMSSVAVILALAIGGILGSSIGGTALSILGMILSIPIGATISIFVKEYTNRE